MKTVLILPYFGNFDKLFPLWLKSCGNNKNVDFIIFTDDRREFPYPPNVFVHYMEFVELRDRIQRMYDFKISLETPYRLCNFKPAYGDIFAEYIQDYDAWGFCDNDLIFGRITRFFPKRTTKRFKIGLYGHLMVLPNDERTRTLYKYGGAYKIAFSTPQQLFFDEETFPKILSKHGYMEYSLKIADLRPRVKRMNVLNEPGREWINHRHAFAFIDGRLLRYYIDMDGKIKNEEYCYIHFLKRPIIVPDDIDSNCAIAIVPNKVINIWGGEKYHYHLSESTTKVASSGVIGKTVSSGIILSNVSKTELTKTA